MMRHFQEHFVRKDDGGDEIATVVFPMFGCTEQRTLKAAIANFKAGKPTIINFSELTPEERIWAIHFLNGVIYALNGKSKDIGSKVFLFAPPNIEVHLGEQEE